MRFKGNPPHPIIERPWEYQVIGFNYQIPIDETPPCIDLALAKGPMIRRLRFLWPRDLTIERGFPSKSGGLEILDVSARQMEEVGVRVHGFEATPQEVVLMPEPTQEVHCCISERPRPSRPPGWRWRLVNCSLWLFGGLALTIFGTALSNPPQLYVVLAFYLGLYVTIRSLICVAIGK